MSLRGRQITTGVTLAVLCAVLVAGAVLGWQQLFAELPDDEPAAAEPSPTCATESLERGRLLRSSQVRVSVYNAGTRSGLAQRTLEQLAARGFEAGEAGNAPDAAQVRRVQVWSNRQNDARARLVALQFGKRTKVQVTDVDLGPGVDVVVGNRYDGLRQASRSVEVTEPESVCIPAGEGSPDGGSPSEGASAAEAVAAR